jgi:hypothetical protein
MTPFSIALNPDEQKIKIISGFFLKILRGNLISLTKAKYSLTINDGGGLDICVESNFIISN